MNDTLKTEIKEAIVRSLRLPMKPDEIGDSVPLFGEGLGLDSIDALEIALAISRTYGFELKSDDARAHHVFESLRSLTRYIDTHRIR